MRCLLLVALLVPFSACAEEMAHYTETIPGTDISFEMVPVPGGVVQVDVSAEGDDPAYVEVDVPPFWVGKTEVTWAEFHRYMALDKAYSQMQRLASVDDAQLSDSPRLASALTRRRTAEAGDLGVDAVTAPTPLYDPSTTYESGEDPALPAVTMTPFAARQYTKWLSSVTGHDYRLPSEAEWLLSATAGGADEDLDSRAWHTDNSDYTAHPVAEKAADKLGLHDVLGNAAELVLDGYYPQGRPELAGKRVGWAEGVAWPRTGDARIAKGGWYDGEVEEATFAARMVSDESLWKSSDPNLPRSPWWYADYPATGVGFRLVRPLKPITAEIKTKVWDTADEKIARAVIERLREGRGKLGPIGADLPAALEELESDSVRQLLK